MEKNVFDQFLTFWQDFEENSIFCDSPLLHCPARAKKIKLYLKKLNSKAQETTYKTFNQNTKNQ